MFRQRTVITAVVILTFVPVHTVPVWAQFRSGAAAIDITPRQLPVIVNGGFIERQTSHIDDPLHARCLVVGNGKVKIAIAIADSCMIPRDVCDEIKREVERKTGIPIANILVAATHTHSAPSLMDYCLGSRQDRDYTRYFVNQVIEGIVQAHTRMEPAEFGWAVVDAPEHTHCRRWIRRPDRPGNDPFGQASVRAMMHPGYQNADYLGPAGPADTGLTLLSFRSVSGKPICVLANYSMHYVGGARGVSSDYWGPFATLMAEKVNAVADADERDTGFVAMMSQGTSGDLHWMDYSQPRQQMTAAKYAEQLVDIAFPAYLGIEYRRNPDLAMTQSEVQLGRRLPDENRIKWAGQVNQARGERLPRNQPEVYAQQAEWIQQNPVENLVLQAIRIGPVGLTTLPNEVFGITGLKLKAQSPLQPTMNLSLANGAAGYIPPPEQHRLGGYTTWPARTAGLEIQAEPKIVEQLLQSLEQISGQRRKPMAEDLYPESIRDNMLRALAKPR